MLLCMSTDTATYGAVDIVGHVHVLCGQMTGWVMLLHGKSHTNKGN